MGLQFRKRTRGKNSWLNFSGSRKNGLGASLSVVFGKGITYNTCGRMTVNFGNGFRYVAYKKKKPAKKIEPKNTLNQDSWLHRMFDAMGDAANREAHQKTIEVEKQSLSFEDRVKMIAEKQAARAKAMREARTGHVDESSELTTNQKRFLLIGAIALIFAIQKCTG